MSHGHGHGHRIAMHPGGKWTTYPNQKFGHICIPQPNIHQSQQCDMNTAFYLRPDLPLIWAHSLFMFTFSHAHSLFMFTFSRAHSLHDFISEASSPYISIQYLPGRLSYIHTCAYLSIPHKSDTFWPTRAANTLLRRRLQILPCQIRLLGTPTRSPPSPPVSNVMFNVSP
jgi:hypothetical protein